MPLSTCKEEGERKKKGGMDKERGAGKICMATTRSLLQLISQTTPLIEGTGETFMKEKGLDGIQETHSLPSSRERQSGRGSCLPIESRIRFMSRLVLGIVAIGLGFGVVHLGRPWHPEELKERKGARGVYDKGIGVEWSFDRCWGGGD